MLFTKTFALPAAILACASFAFAQQGGEAPQPTKADLAKAGPVLKEVGEELVGDQIYLEKAFREAKPNEPDVEGVRQALFAILGTLTNAEANLTAVASDVVPKTVPNQVEQSVLFSDILNTLVPSATLALSLKGNPLSLNVDRVTAKTLDVLKICCERLHVTIPGTIASRVADPTKLEQLSNGFKTISDYLKGDYPSIH